jgi:large subunit ribosomal protein L25
MDVITLEAKGRVAGKVATKAVRREEQVPCVLYGQGEEPRIFQIPEISMRELVYTDQFHRVSINLDGEAYDCVLKRTDFHPVTDSIIHADFYVLHPGENVTIRVPVHFNGIAEGVREGGVQQEFVHKIAVTCLPKNLPDFIEVDVSSLTIGQSILVRDISVEGVEIKAPGDSTLVSIDRPRAIIVVEEEEDEEGLEGEEGEEGVEGEGAAEGSEASEKEGGEKK